MNRILRHPVSWFILGLLGFGLYLGGGLNNWLAMWIPGIILQMIALWVLLTGLNLRWWRS